MLEPAPEGQGLEVNQDFLLSVPAGGIHTAESPVSCLSYSEEKEEEKTHNRQTDTVMDTAQTKHRHRDRHRGSNTDTHTPETYVS